MQIDKKLITEKLNLVKAKACELADDAVIIGKNVLKEYKERSKKPAEAKKPEEKK